MGGCKSPGDYAALKFPPPSRHDPAIGGITLRLTGKRIPPHFFRDAAATTLTRESPEAARLIGPILGHTATGTAERHYIQARSIEAARDYADVLRRLRQRW